ncbi:MAG: hypothetical protein RLZZ396_1182 [Planctomycetota bacterium]
MTRSRRNFTPQEKAAIVLRHLVDKKAVFAPTKTSEDPEKFQNHLKKSAFAERSCCLLDT